MESAVVERLAPAILASPRVSRNQNVCVSSASAEPDAAPTFWLRLTRGLARIAGASLMATADSIALVMPQA